MNTIIIGGLMTGFGSFAMAGKNKTIKNHKHKSKTTEFYYHTYGGFIKDDGNVSHRTEGSASYFRAGQDDINKDGIWFREGPFSKNVQFGDQNNGNKADTNDPHNQDPNNQNAYPAIAWGHPETHPWVSEGGPGDDIGGASGIGLIGYGYKDTGNKKNRGRRRIVVGDNAVLYPLGGMQHHNFPITFGGTMSTWISWNMELYDKKGKRIFKGNNIFHMYQWETINVTLDDIGNFTSDPNGCPRSIIDSTGMSALAFNTMQSAKYPYWPQNGHDFLFKSDGDTETSICSDAFGYIGGTNKVDFSIGKKRYTIKVDGFWHYHEELEGCPKLNRDLFNVPMSDDDKYWQIKCFTRSPTFWSGENNVNTGWVRLQIVDKEKSGQGNTCKDIKPIDSLALRWQGDKTIGKINVWFSEVGKGGNPPAQVITEPVDPNGLLIVNGLSEDNPKDIVLELFDENGNKIGESIFHLSCSEEDLNDPSDCGGTVGSGKNDDPGWIKQWGFEGMGGMGGNPEDFCSAH